VRPNPAATPPREKFAPPPRGRVSEEPIRRTDPYPAFADEEEERLPEPESPCDETSSQLMTRDTIATSSKRPVSIPKLDLTIINQNAGNPAPELNSRQWRQAPKPVSRPLGGHDNRTIGFAQASPEDQQRIAEFYGYRPEDFAAAMHGLRTDQIRPRLFIGTMADAAHWPCMNSLNITHVLNCAVQAQKRPPPYESKGLKYLCLPFHDTAEQAELLQKSRFSMLRTATRFIRSALREKPDSCVLVHCVQGMARSAVVVCAYLMEYEGMALDRALSEVQTKHTGCLTAQHWQACLNKFNAALLKDP